MGELSRTSSVSEMVKLYALCERALLYDWCLCAGEYSLVEYSGRVLPVFLSSFLSRQISRKVYFFVFNISSKIPSSLKMLVNKRKILIF